MKTLRIDIETYSPVDLRKTGVYPYSEHPDFQVLLFGYAFDDEPVQVVDLAQGEEIPQDVIAAMTDPEVRKTAYNAAFERVCLRRHFGYELPIEQWRCTSVHALVLGLPGHLADVAVVCKLPPELQKMTEGAALIRYFCLPCKPTKKNGERTRNYPSHDPDKWALFKSYCARDVEVERAIAKQIQRWDLHPEEWRLYHLDQRINDKGMAVDLQLVDSAIDIDNDLRDSLTTEFVKLTGVTNPRSVTQIKTWLSEDYDLELPKLNKEVVKELLKTNSDVTINRAMQLRQQLAKSSVAKYHAMKRSVCRDGRIRGLLQFYGANRTGRFAGRIVQIQNLPKSELSPGDLDLARRLVKAADVECISLMYGAVPPLLSELIRTAFIAPDGKFYVVVDFSAIEARMLAWGAWEEWRLDVFNTHGKIYEASAEQMFGLPPGSVDKKTVEGNAYRQKGKVSELALGYQGGPGALITMGALKMGLKEDELPPIVKAWRAANPNVCKFWWDIEAAAKTCIRRREPVEHADGRYKFTWESGFLFMELPSGRRLAYVKPRIERSGGYEQITFDGLDQDTKRWGRVDTYGGKLCENWTQAASRDCLREALFTLEAAGFTTVGHVHDEVILECDLTDWGSPEAALHEAERLMGRPISYYDGLPLKGDGFISTFYRKDS